MNYKNIFLSKLSISLFIRTCALVLIVGISSIYSLAQDKNETPENYQGRQVVKDKRKKNQGTKDLTIKSKKAKTNQKSAGTNKLTQKAKPVRTERQIGDDASMQAGFLGSVKVRNNDKTVYKNSKDIGNYAGKISVRKLRNAQRERSYNQDDISNFGGNVRITNTVADRRKASKRIAQFRGNIPIKSVRKPRGSITSTYRGAPNRNRTLAKYDRNSLKKGTRIKKSDLPNYQKNKPAKLKFNARETRMWMGEEKDSRVPTANKRELPKNNKRKNRKAARKSTKQSSEEEPWYGEEEEEDY